MIGTKLNIDALKETEKSTINILEGQWFAWTCWALSVTAIIAMLYSWITKRGYHAWDIFFAWPLMELATYGVALFFVVEGDFLHFAFLDFCLSTAQSSEFFHLRMSIQETYEC
jgi:hypothetical protein